MNQFQKLGLSPQVIEVLDKIGFETPTPIQEQAIPILLNEDPVDFIGLAQTGTGKTAAFGLPLIDLIDRNNGATQALIMAPTRELGQQTAKQLVDFASMDRKINVECVYGGSSIMNQIKALRGPVQILVATPGRLLDLINRRAVKLDQVKYVVLDEADEMLNMGFKEDIDLILEKTPEERVTWLFSATMPKEIRRIIKKYMDNPREVAVNTEQKTNLDITHQYIVTKVSDKVAALRRFLDLQPDMRGILFCRTRRETQKIADDLGELGYGVEALHGELSQAQRDAVMRRFKNRSMQLLVATDVAARGIDVNDLTHVMHHTLPDQLESYTHRSGRTGRAGNKGISLAFINNRESRKINELEYKIGITFEKVEVPSIDEVKSLRFDSWAKDFVGLSVNDDSDEVYAALEAKFEGLEKEDILKRLISVELAKLNAQAGDGDLNDNGQSNARSQNKNPNANRYFINVGSIDGITERELLEFLQDVSEVNAKNFSSVSLTKNCAFFNVDKAADNGFADAFKGLEVDGRLIRVNKDDEGARPPRRGGGGGGGFRGKGGGNRGGGGNRDRRGGNIDNRRSGGGNGKPRNAYGSNSGGGSRSGSGGKKRRY